jgi:peptidyl-tRNA hydrolase
MSFFDSFLGGAAEAGTGMLQNQMKNDAAEEQARRMAQFQEQLAMDRQKTVMDLKRQYDLKAGQEIDAKAAEVSKQRVDASLDASNPIVDKATWTPEMEAARNQGKKGIIASASRADKLDDRAAAAESLGYLEQAKEVRGQQQIENAREFNERRAKTDDDRWKSTERRLDIQAAKDAADTADRNKRMDWQETFQTRQLAQQKELHAISANRASASESKAERSAMLSATGGIVKDTAGQMKEFHIRLADPMLDPATKKVYESQLASATELHNQALAQYGKLAGIEPQSTTKAEAKKEYPVATPDAVKYLMDNPSAVQKFKSTFGEGQIPLEFYSKQSAMKPAGIISSAPVSQFNPAGYGGIEETIAGAQRGDAKALQYLKQLIDEGGTTPSQRLKINKLIGQK